MGESDAPRPPGTLRALRILTRIGFRRRVARLGYLISRRRKSRAAGASRGPTLRKRTGGGWLLAFFGLLMLWNSGFLSHQFLSRMGEAGRARTVHELAHRLCQARPELDLEHALILVEDEWQLRSDPTDEAAPTTFAHRVLRRWIAEERAAAAGPSRVAIGLTLLLAVLAVFLSQLGARNQDLGQVEWSMEWLFTFPVSTRAIFLAKILEYAVADFLAWCIFAPFLFAVGLWSGAGFAALPLALIGAFYLNLLLAAVQVGLETWLRMRLGPSRLKNAQGACTFAGIVLLLGAMGVALSPAGPGVALEAAGVAGGWVEWLPTAWPILLLGGGALAAAAGAGMLGIAVVLVAGALGWVGRQVSGGLQAETGTYRGARAASAARIAPRSSRFRGVVGKDLKLLWRDRNLFVQTLIVPAVIVGFQVVVNPSLLAELAGDFEHVPAIAFGLGAYILMFSAAQSLAVEGNALWLLLTAPVRLERVILGKAALWGTFSAVLPTGLMVWAALRAPVLTAAHVTAAVLALAGLFIYALIAAGLGALATDVLEPNVKRRMRPATLYMFMLLAALYAWALYAPDVWQRIGMLVICGSLAFSVWQKFKDNAPYLLDPTARPPRRIGLAHGVVALLSFFVLKNLIVVALVGTKVLGSGPGHVVAYATAGVSVVAVVFLYMALTDAEHESPVRDTAPAGWLRSLGAGGMFGMAAGALGLAWLAVVELVAPLRAWRDSFDILDLGQTEGRIWMVVLAVVAAPLVEEFLFRWLIYRSLRRAVSVGIAVIGSALLFAVVHPPISVAPVFVLGAAAALVYERTGRLVAPIVAHAVYNALIVGATIWWS